jgi:hypothetical protein
MTKWREHLRVIATLVNGLFVVLLFGTKGWFLSVGLGLPFVLPPLLAILALAVNRKA